MVPQDTATPLLPRVGRNGGEVFEARDGGGARSVQKSSRATVATRRRNRRSRRALAGRRTRRSFPGPAPVRAPAIGRGRSARRARSSRRRSRRPASPRPATRRRIPPGETPPGQGAPPGPFIPPDGPPGRFGPGPVGATLPCPPPPVPPPGPPVPPPAAAPPWPRRSEVAAPVGKLDAAGDQRAVRPQFAVDHDMEAPGPDVAGVLDPDAGRRHHFAIASRHPGFHAESS